MGTAAGTEAEAIASSDNTASWQLSGASVINIDAVAAVMQLPAQVVLDGKRCEVEVPKLPT